LSPLGVMAGGKFSMMLAFAIQVTIDLRKKAEI
jgi:hypothetical protein